MFKLFIFAAILALAIAAPSGVVYPGLFGYSPYSALIPGPYAYHSGYSVINSVEPVEQHGYRIAY